MKKIKCINKIGVKLVGIAAASLLWGCAGSQKKFEPLPEAKTPAEAKFVEGLKAGREDNWQAAANYFAAAYKLDATLISGKVNHGIALERGGDMKEAAALFEEAAKADPANIGSAINLARVYVALGRIGDATKVLQPALKAHPGNIDLLNTHAVILRLDKKFVEAINVARKVLMQDQVNAAATKSIGLTYADMGKLTLAETFLRNALKLNEKDASIFVNLGLIQARRGNEQRALFEFEEGLKLEGDNGVAHANIGAIALRWRDYGRAAKSYEKALKAGVVNCDTSSALGYAFEGMQQGKEALAQLGKAYELCPAQKDLLFSMGTVCMAQLRDNDCALEKYQAYQGSKQNLAKDHRVHGLIDAIKAMQAQEEAGPVELPADEGGTDSGAEGDGQAVDAGASEGEVEAAEADDAASLVPATKNETRWA